MRRRLLGEGLCPSLPFLISQPPAKRLAPGVGRRSSLLQIPGEPALAGDRSSLLAPLQLQILRLTDDMTPSRVRASYAIGRL